MLLESLIVYTCLHKKGCSTASQAYYQSKPELKEIAQNIEKEAKKITNPVIYNYGMPIVMAVVKKTATVSLGHGISLKVDSSNPQGSKAFILLTLPL